MITLMYQLILLSVLVEIFASLSSRYMRVLSAPLAGLSIVMTSFSAVSYAAFTMNVYAVVIAVVAVVRVFSIGRILKYRMHKTELRKRTLVSALVYGSITAGLVIAASNELSLGATTFFSYFVLVTSLLLLTSIVVSLIKYRLPTSRPSAGGLPTISVCIPARNETPGLAECIQSVVDTSYPKLEILVLDDCSHDKTPQIIKAFARHGVRFIKGQQPDGKWLPKNSAYQRLAQESKGDILVFMGVDVVLSKDSLNYLPTLLETKDMVSVMPQRSSAVAASLFMQPLRYWWELALWRFGLLDPPVLSTFWAVNASSLRKAGEFAGLRKASSPESALAKKFNSMRGYLFVLGKGLDISSNKSPKQQWDTSVRTRYIQMGRSMELGFSVMLLELSVALLPLTAAVWAVIYSVSQPGWVYIAAAAAVAMGNLLIYRLVAGKAWVLGLVTVPFLAVADAIVIIRSMYGYEYGEIVWKDRNICLPMLQAEKSLPALPDSKN